MTKVAQIGTHRAATVSAARAEPELSLVPVAAPGERALQLFTEARSISLEHLAALQAAIVGTRDLADEVVAAGDLYAVGLQDFARRLSEELFWRAKALEALAERQGVVAHRRQGSRAS
jgi:hypothetical protein